MIGYDFEPRHQFPVSGIHHMELTVGQPAARPLDDELRAVRHRLGPRAAKRQFDAQVSGTGGRFLHHEVLAHPIHTH